MTFQVSESTCIEPEYALIDFGEGRKLERFGEILLDRPCPAAGQAQRLLPQAWCSSRIVVGSSGKVLRGELPSSPWQIQFCGLRFQLALTPFGHVGLFPEQASNWRWLLNRIDRKRTQPSTEMTEANHDGLTHSTEAPTSALNLFGYTGAATLLLASLGCGVVHLDASAPSVAWARKNAELNGFSNAPIRWIIDDARKFVDREVRRRKVYDVVVLDPPTYGHGPTGSRWELHRDLPSLLNQCARLLAPAESIILVSCHSQGVTPEDIVGWLGCSEHTASNWTWEAGRLSERDSNRRRLDFGLVARGERRSR